MTTRWVREAFRYIRHPYGTTTETTRSIREEILFHLTEEARQCMQHGAAAPEACESAIRRFGDLEGALRGCHEVAAHAYARCHRFHLAFTALSLLTIVALAYAVATRLNDGKSAGQGDVVGQVVDDQSRPINGAHVLAVVKTWPQGGFRQQAHAAMTRSDGAFEIADVYPIDEEYELQIAIVSEGRVLESTYVDMREGQLDPLEFQLKPTSAVTVRFESQAGEPLQGVEVFPSARGDSAGDQDTVYFCSAGPVTRHSDGGGRVSLPFFNSGDRAAIYVRPPGGDWNRHEFQVAESEQEIVIKLRPAPQ